MPKVSRGAPRSRNLRTASDGAPRAGAAQPVVDNKRIWFGRSMGLFSIPNSTSDSGYFRIEVANLNNDDYELIFERVPIGTTMGIAFPASREISLDRPADPDLAVQRYGVGQGSGAMFSAPRQTRVHIGIRLTRDRKDVLSFAVALYEHASPDRMSPLVRDEPVLKTLEWIPAPTADKVETKLFSVPGKFLFWELPDEPDWVRFRRWNVTPRAGRFPWSLRLFNHPECIVRVTNNSTLAVLASPTLVFGRTDGKSDEIVRSTEEILDTRSELKPGDEREWPCAISLADRRLPKQEADQLRISAYADVVGPGNSPIGKVDAAEQVKGEYITYPSKVIDWVAMIGGGLLLIMCLFFFIYGPVPVSEYAYVDLQINNLGVRPKGVDLDVHLIHDGIQELGRWAIAGNETKYKFKLTPQRIWTWRFGAGEIKLDYKVSVNDRSGQYDTKPTEQPVKLVVYPALNESEPQSVPNFQLVPNDVTVAKRQLDEKITELGLAMTQAENAMKHGHPEQVPTLLAAADAFSVGADALAQKVGPGAQASQLKQLQGQLLTDHTNVASLTKQDADAQAAAKTTAALDDMDAQITKGNAAVQVKDMKSASDCAQQARGALDKAMIPFGSITTPNLKSGLQMRIDGLKAKLQSLVTSTTTVPGGTIPNPVKL